MAIAVKNAFVRQNAVGHEQLVDECQTISTSDSTFEAGKPAALFPTRIVSSHLTGFHAQYGVSRDGRFLINGTEEDSAAPITLILNWKPK